MEKKDYYKLVRDKIPNIIRKNGGKCKIWKLNRKAHLEALFKKTEEERLEFLSADTADKRLSEAADLTEVVLKIWQLQPVSTFKQKTARQVFRSQFEDDSVDVLAELKIHTASLLKADLTEQEVAAATGAQVEALLCLIAKDGYTVDDLNQRIGTARKERGGFDKGYFLVWATAQ